MIRFIFHWLGVDDPSGRIYLFWSGFFGDITIFSAIIYHYFHKQCHHRRCLRPGKHTVNGTPYCTKHKETIT